MPALGFLLYLSEHTMGKDKKASPSKYSTELEDLVSTFGLILTL